MCDPRLVVEHDYRGIACPRQKMGQKLKEKMSGAAAREMPRTMDRYPLKFTSGL